MSKKPIKELLVCITAHAEGPMIQESIDSISPLTKSTTFRIDSLIVLDRPNSATESYLDNRGHHCLRVDFGDVGEARNYVLDRFADSYRAILFLDGDDYCSTDWIESLLPNIELETQTMVYSPSQRILFWPGRIISLVFHQPNWKTPHRFWKVHLSTTNLWGSCVLIPQEIARLARYRSEAEGYAFEDWWFNYDLSEAGFGHASVEGKYFYRQGSNVSRLRLQNIKLVSDGLSSPRRIEGVFGKLAGALVLLLRFRGFKLLK